MRTVIKPVKTEAEAIEINAENNGMYDLSLGRLTYMNRINDEQLLTTYEAQPITSTSQETRIWECRKQQIRMHDKFGFVEKFFISFYLGLRANVTESIIFSGTKKREEGLGESILANALKIICNDALVFKDIVEQRSKGEKLIFDWCQDRLNTTTSTLFGSGISVNEVCEQVAIEITEFYINLFKEDIVREYKYAQQLATNALAFVLYTVNIGVVTSQQNIRKQLIYYFEGFFEYVAKDMREQNELSVKNSRPVVSSNLIHVKSKYLQDSNLANSRSNQEKKCCIIL